jgi:23S rRNA (guanine745-N1)-methyltransferase
MENAQTQSSEPGHAVSLLCPVCSDPLTTDAKQAICSNRHTFDRAKEGYFNLLLANQKGSNDPGDDRESITARRAFLSAGHYDFLRDGIRSIVSAETQTILDAGCGEGYFLSQIAPGPGYGVDISRSGVRLAARTHKSYTWAVANIARQIPISDNSCDVILSVMAPRNTAEFHRILTPSGLLIAVIPGPDHLNQLTSKLMDHDPNQSSKPRLLLEDLSPQFEFTDETRVSHDIIADQDTISNLITMTPLRWKSRKQSLTEVADLKSLTITADFRILTLSAT